MTEDRLGGKKTLKVGGSPDSLYLLFLKDFSVSQSKDFVVFVCSIDTDK